MIKQESQWPLPVTILVVSVLALIGVYIAGMQPGAPEWIKAFHDPIQAILYAIGQILLNILYVAGQLLLEALKALMGSLKGQSNPGLPLQ